MHGSSVVLQTRFKSVVLPALARPMTRIRKCLYLCRRSTTSWKLLMLVVVVQGKEMISIDEDSSLLLVGTKETETAVLPTSAQTLRFTTLEQCLPIGLYSLLS